MGLLDFMKYKKVNGGVNVNILSKIIEEAVRDCVEFGSGYEELDNVIISAEWESYSKDSNYDVVVVYIIEDGVVKFNYELDETKVSN